MTDGPKDNVLIVHWHDLGRYLGAYGHADVSQPAAGRAGRRGHPVHPRARHRAAVLAVAGLTVHRSLSAEQRAGRAGPPRLGVPRRSAHAARDPVRSGLAYRAFRYAARDLVSVPARLRRVRRVQLLLRVCGRARDRVAARPAEQPFLLTAGFFETHRPYPHRPLPARRPPTRSTCPTTCPTPLTSGQDLADFYGSITVADAAVGQLLDTLDDDGPGPHHLGGVRHRPRPRAAPREVHALRRGHRHRVDRPAAAATHGRRPRVYDDLFSGVDLLPTLLELLGVQVPADVDGLSHARNLLRIRRHEPSRTRQVYTTKTYHDSFDPIRAISTKEYSYIENYAPRRCSTCRGTSRRVHPGRRSRRWSADHAPSANSTTCIDDPDRIAQPARPGRDGQGRGDRE